MACCQQKCLAEKYETQKKNKAKCCVYECENNVNPLIIIKSRNCEVKSFFVHNTDSDKEYDA